GTLKLLERLGGETIRMRFVPAGTLWPVCIDPAQLDQLIFHLCLNAQDAIEGEEGEIAVEISNDAGGAQLAVVRPDFAFGDYVRLRVRDTGCGMMPNVLDHMFDPFFTTKPDHAGLGMTTVFGIAKQNKGYVVAASGAEKGSVVDVYLPRYVKEEQKLERNSC
ncbi:MAG: sensor histidine kinase, partial [Kiritimatiellia bacterium]